MKQRTPPLKRKTPMPRGKPLRQRRREGADVEREEKPRSSLPSVQPRQDVRYGGSVSGVAVPKGPQTKPGKRAPTKDERAWMDALIEYGCICCRMQGCGHVPPEIHHILLMGRRRGHLFTLPLCTNHHRGGAEFSSRHPWKERFEQRYGTEMGLLSTLQGVLKKQPDGSYAVEGS